MKLTSDNLKKIFNYIEYQLEDDDGRGEFDEETSILSAVDRTIEMFKENKDDWIYRSTLRTNFIWFYIIYSTRCCFRKHKISRS